MWNARCPRVDSLLKVPDSIVNFNSYHHFHFSIIHFFSKRKMYINILMPRSYFLHSQKENPTMLHCKRKNKIKQYRKYCAHIVIFPKVLVLLFMNEKNKKGTETAVCLHYSIYLKWYAPQKILNVPSLNMNQSNEKDAVIPLSFIKSKKNIFFNSTSVITVKFKIFIQFWV